MKNRIRPWILFMNDDGNKVNASEKTNRKSEVYRIYKISSKQQRINDLPNKRKKWIVS